MPDRLRSRLTLFFALGFTMVAPCGCGSGNSTPRVATPAAATTAVGVVAPQRKILRRIIELPGTVQAYEETLLFARVSGNLRLTYEPDGKLTHDIGRKIAGPTFDSTGKEVPDTGEALAELIVPELEQDKMQKEALVRQSTAEVDQAAKALLAADANIAVAAALVSEAQAQSDRWKSERTRMAGLAKEKIIDPQSNEETGNQFKAAEARLAYANASVRKASADREKAEADVRAAKSRVDVATAEAQRAKTMWDYRTIRAPFDGVVSGRKATSGKLVQPGAAAEDWIFKVTRLDPVRVVVAVPETEAESVRENAEVKMTIAADSPLPRRGTVARTSWTLDPRSRTLRTEIDLANPDHRLRPGMYVAAEIHHPFPEGWTLPVAAVSRDDATMVCFLVENGKAARTPILVGGTDGKSIVVLKIQKKGSSSWDDLTGSEQVAGKAGSLTDGQAVRTESLPK